MIEKDDTTLAALDASIAKGLADIEAGKLYDAEEVFDELDAELAELEAEFKAD